MRITAHGYSRNAGDTVIVDQGIQKERTQTYPIRRPKVINILRKSNEVRMIVGPVPLSFNGRYWVTVQFTDEDIARLFLEAHPEFRTAVEAIFAKPESTAQAAE